MKLEGEQTLLRVHLRGTDRHGWFGAPASDLLVDRARSLGMAGVTVLRGFFGVDPSGHLLERHAWSLSEDVPVIVELVDSPRAIGRFLEAVAAEVPELSATLERSHVLLYRQSRDAAERAAMTLEAPGRVAPFSTLPMPEEFPIMTLSEEGQLLRVFIGESDSWQDQPLYRAIVLKARELGLAGATVLRGAMGFGANSRVHTTNLLELSTDLPIVVELVDSAEKINLMLPFLDESVGEGLITIEGVRVLRYRHNQHAKVSRPGPRQT